MHTMATRNALFQFLHGSIRTIRPLARKAARTITALTLMASVVWVAPAQTVPAFAAGTTYYVAKTGSDTTGDGSQAKPWASIQKAADSIAAGSSVHVAVGTYDERVTISSSKSGSAALTTKFIADGKVVVAKGIVVNSSYTDLTGFEITPGTSGYYYTGQVSVSGVHNTLTGFYIHDTTGSGSAGACALYFGNGAAYNTFTDFTIERCYQRGIGYYPGDMSEATFHAGDTATHDNIVSNGEISQFGDIGVFMLGTANVLDGVDIHNQWLTGGLKGDGAGDGVRPIGVDLVIRNCKIHHIHQNWATQHADAIQFYYGTTNLLVENNVLGSWCVDGVAGWDSDACIMISSESGNSSMTVRNNVFLGGASLPINVNTGADAQHAFTLRMDVYNNIFWTRGSPRTGGASGYTSVASVFRNNIFKEGIYTEGSRYTLDSDYNLFLAASKKPVGEGSHSVVAADPRLVNPDITSATDYGVSANFGLKSDSPAIGRADASHATPTDFTGVARDAQPDIGAFEYRSTLPPTDTTAPTVSITSPTAGSTVSGSVAIAATATDTVGVTGVEFRADGVLLGTDATAPYTSTWDATSATAGSHTITARAVDAAGNAATSTVAVTVPAPADTTAPALAITAPVADATVSGSVAVAATASDAGSGVNRVEFRADGVLLGTDTTAPYGSAWDASSAQSGSHVIEAKAVDNSGNATTKSEQISILPQVADTTAPVTTASIGGTRNASGWYLSAPSVTLSANETATTQYQWDSATGSWNSYTAPITAPEGVHTLFFRSTDTAGNVATADSTTLRVDSGKPVITALTSSSHPDADVPSNASVAVFSFAGSDAISGVSGYSYSLDSVASGVPDTVSEGTSTNVSVAVTADGVWYLHVRALDAAGNWGSAASRKITVDRTAPSAPVLAAAAGTSTVGLAWAPASDAVATRILRSTGGAATSLSDGSATLMYEGSGTTYADSSAVAGTTYYYTAFSRDAAGNWSSSGIASVTIALSSPQSALVLSSSAKAVTAVQYFTLRGGYSVGGVPARAPASVTVWANNSGSWKKLGTASYNSVTASYELRTRVKRSTSFEMRIAGDSTRSAIVSNRVTVTLVSSVTVKSPSRTTSLTTPGKVAQ